MIPRRAEGVLLDQPARREDDEIGDGGARVLRLRGQDCEDGWIGVVEGDAADDIEAAEVVLVGIVEPMPCNDVERCVVLAGTEEVTIEFGDQRPFVSFLMILVVARDGRLEVSRIGQAIGADGAKLGEFEVVLVELEDVAAHGAFWQSDAVPDTAGDDANLIWAYQEAAKFSLDIEDTVLKDL